MFMMNLANSIYKNFRNSVVGNKLNHNNRNFDTEHKDIINYDMTNYMIESNNKANKLYKNLNSSRMLSKILQSTDNPNTDIEYDHNNETIICHKQYSNHFIRTNGFKSVLVFIFGVLAHFHFQRSHR